MQLEASHVSFRYDKGPWLFRNVNIRVEPGEAVGLTGPSGCGKSTLARILAGYLQPVEGKVTLGDERLPGKGYQPVQLVLQHPEKAVNPRWRMHRVLSEANQHEQAVLDALGIQNEWLMRWPGELSGGELQRFCLARALGPRTRFLISDEMTSMLDAVTQAQIWHFMLEYTKLHQLGMLVISHEEALLQRICSRMIRFEGLVS